MPKHLTPVFVLIVASIAWGTTWMPLKFFDGQGIEGALLVFISQLILALVFFPFGFRQCLIPAHLKGLIGISLVGGGAVLSFTYALIHGDVIRVMVLFYLLPVWGALGGKLFLNERMDSIRWLGVGLAIIGAFLIVGGHKIFESPPTWIDFIALLSGILFAGNNIIFRRERQLKLSSKLLAMFMGSASLALVVIYFTGQSIALDISPAIWGLLVLYSLVWLLIANLGSQWGVTQLEAGQSSIILVVELVAAVITAMIFGEERLTFMEWLGCLLVLSATLLETVRFSKEAAQAEYS